MELHSITHLPLCFNFVDVSEAEGVKLVKLLEILLYKVQVLITPLDQIQPYPVVDLLHVDIAIVQNETIVAPLLLLIGLRVNWQQVVRHLVLLVAHQGMHLEVVAVPKILLKLLL